MSKILKIFLICLCLFPVCLTGKSRKSQGKNIRNPNKLLVQAKDIPQIKKPDTQITPTPKSTVPPTKKEDLKVTNKKSFTPGKPALEEKTKEELKEKEEEIYLNFENAELINFINYIAELRKINIVPDKTIAGNKISLSIRNPISREQAWRILLTITEMAGFSMIKVGDVYKVIPKDKKIIEPLPTYINVPVDTLPDSDENIRYICILTNVKVTDIKPWIDSMLGTPHLAILNESANALILTDKSYNIKSVMKIIQEIDKTGLKESLIVIRLKEANATEVRDLFNSLIEGPKEDPQTARLQFLLGRRPESRSSYFSPGTKIIAEDRTNSLILLGSRESTEQIEKFIKENIDIKLKGIDSPLHVYELQYTDAKQMVALLKEAVAAPESPTGQQATKYGAVRSGVKYFKSMTLKEDTEGNRIIASTSDKQDWKLLKQTIKNLDKPQPQVAIETLIVTIDSTDNKYLGGQVRNKKHGLLGKGVDFQSAPINQIIKSENPTSLLGNLISGLTGGLGSTLLTFGRENNIWGIFKILQSITHTSVVAKPFLSVANKYEAKVVIGETRQLERQTTYDNNSLPIRGYEDVQANLEINVKPQINISGVIQLDIKVSNNEFGDSAETRYERKLETNVSVANGQVIALGGLVKNKITEINQKSPILGNIPILGWLFKNKTKNSEKQHILIFLSPTIIKPRFSAGMGLYTRIKLHKSKDSLEKSVEDRTRDPIHNWFFDPDKKDYSHKVEDFASARYQPVTVDIVNDEYYRAGLKEKNNKQNYQNTKINKKGTISGKQGVGS